MKAHTVENSLLHGVLPPRDTTEWGDIHRRLGNFAPLPEEPVPILITPAKTDEERDHEKLEAASLGELDELEDDFDDTILNAYRQKRMAEMMQEAERNKYGYVKEITAPDWVSEVTDASRTEYVIVHLFKPSIPHCVLLEKRLGELATKFKATKFVRCLSHHAIPNYPDRNLPTLLIYKDSDPVDQIITLSSLGGDSITAKDLEWRLSQSGAIETTMKKNPRTPQIHGLHTTTRSSHHSDDSDSSNSDSDD
ncbi:viral IAP-associated factor [Pelomyxa schiedti]|nr:viral IAP-associated factor [Pelomyxa schiedti]